MKIVILDRDGVINYDSKDYIKSPKEWKPIPGSLEAIAQLNRHGYKIVLASNQSGLARGFFDMQTLNNIRPNRARISELEALLRSLRLETSQLEHKFENEIRKVNKFALRMRAYTRADTCNSPNLYSATGELNGVAFGEELIRRWSLRRLLYKYDQTPLFGDMSDSFLRLN